MTSSLSATYRSSIKRRFALELQQQLEDAGIDTDLQLNSSRDICLLDNARVFGHLLTVLVMSRTVMSPLTYQNVDMITIHVASNMLNSKTFFPLTRQFVDPLEAHKYIMSFETTPNPFYY